MVSPDAYAADYVKARDDVVGGLRSWRIWWLLGMGDIRQRYRRSRLGQFWLTLSMAIFIGAVGAIYATLFRQPINTYLPFITCTVVTWFLVSGIVVDATTVFIQSESYIRQEPIPKMVFVLRSLVRNFIAFLHNVVLVPLVFLVFGVKPTWALFLVPVGIAYIVIFGALVSIVIGILCTRYRDLPQIVASLMQVAFFVTPVTWPIETLGDRQWIIAYFNPFYWLVALVADPLLGRVPPLAAYVCAIALLCAIAVVAVPLFAKFRKRIVFWL